jgi:metallophosphoesterase (TIGR00282 family)
MWDKKEGVPLVRSDERILRPANYPPGVDGRGWGVYHGRSGTPYAVVLLAGRVFLGDLDCPFRWADGNLPAVRKAAACVFVDFHAEATSEKRALGFYLDGRVSAIAGTHTHVQTSDAQILPKGTGYITDAGMCGPAGSVIGMDPQGVLRRFLHQVPVRFEVGAREPEASGVFFDIDPSNGIAGKSHRSAQRDGNEEHGYMETFSNPRSGSRRNSSPKRNRKENRGFRRGRGRPVKRGSTLRRRTSTRAHGPQPESQAFQERGTGGLLNGDSRR